MRETEIEGRVQRIFKATAKPGRGDELAALLAEAGAQAGEKPSCELYLIARDPKQPEDVWVTEIWANPEAARAALKEPGVPERIEQVKELIAEWGEGHELVPAGGLDVGSDGTAPASEAGDAAPASGGGKTESVEPKPGYELRNMDSFEDAAAAHGYGEFGEARFPFEAMGLSQASFSHHRIRPGKRQAFGHQHDQAEEVYMVIAGTGRVKLDEEILELRSHDVLRVSPSIIRAFESGPDGMELLAFGARHAGDGAIKPGWWSD